MTVSREFLSLVFSSPAHIKVLLYLRAKNPDVFEDELALKLNLSQNEISGILSGFVSNRLATFDTEENNYQLTLIGRNFVDKLCEISSAPV